MLKKLLNQAILGVTLEAQGPLLIKSGTEGGADPSVPDMQFARSDGQVYIPGSSLKGVFRSYAEKIARTVNVKCCNPFDDTLRSDQKQIAVPDHGYGGKRMKVETFAKKLAQFPWTVRVQTIPYGNKSRTSIRDIYDDGRIEVDVKTGEFSAGLEVRTTAQTKGQAERVARELEKFLR